MNTLEIYSCLNKNKFTKPSFKGVLAANQLPQRYIRTNGKTICFVVNLHEEHQPGIHWISFVITDKILEYFDSLGKTFRRNRFFKNFVKINKSKRTFVDHKKKIQSDYSDCCGEMCCLYILFRSKQKQPKDFFKVFSEKDYLKNDSIAEKFFRCSFSCSVCVKNYKNIRIQKCLPNFVV